MRTGPICRVEPERYSPASFILWAITVTALGLLFAAPLPARAESLEEAIGLALKGDPTLTSAEASLRAAEARRQGAAAEFWPTFSLSTSTGASYSRNNDFDSTDSSSAVGVEASQPVYTGGQLRADLNAAKFNRDEAEASLSQTANEIVLSTVEAYVDALLAEERIKVREEERNRLLAEVARSQQLYEVGEAVGVDVARAQADEAAARSALASAKADLIDAITRLAQRTGTRIEGFETPAAPAMPDSLEEARERLLSASPRLLAQRAAEKSASENVASAEAAYAPDISISASAQRSGSGDIFDDGTDSASVTLRLSMPLYDSGRIDASVAAAEAQKFGARADLQATERDLGQQLESIWFSIEALDSAITANEERLRSARLASDVARLERETGLKTTLDYLEVISDERDAALEVASSRRDALLVRYQLLALLGEAAGR
ncbi:MAG: TolC family protein [Alphaproteobacteria bacterium]|nr:TolC family protein [Alphaproteobacteria bacterium]